MTPVLCAAALAIPFAVAVAPELLAQAGNQELKLTVGKSVVIDYPSDIGRISTSNPDVVDAVPITAREILINAKANGQGTLVVWSKTGERSFFSVTVDQNLEPIQKLLKDTFPNETIDVRAARDSASLNGRVSSQMVSDRAQALVIPMVKSVVNNLQIIAGPVEKQIVLHVKFASLDRSRADQLGVNILSTGAANTPGRITTGQFPSGGPQSLTGTIGGAIAGTVSQFSLADALNIFAFRPDLNLGVIIKALQSENILQILAESWPSRTWSPPMAKRRASWRAANFRCRFSRAAATLARSLSNSANTASASTFFRFTPLTGRSRCISSRSCPPSI